MQNPTSDQLRDRIDRGETGEKVAMPDPAAAPLGTDAEAAGATPTREERRLEAASSPAAANAGPRRPMGIGIYALLVAAVAAAIVLILVLALN